MAPPAQQHRIQRVVIELGGCTPANAAALQWAIQRRFSQTLLPEIERRCSALASPQQVLRIDRLAIDLGALPAAAWLGSADVPPVDAATAGPALQQRFQVRLAEGLAQALQAATPVQADEELVAFGLQTGMLPWWADAGDRLALQRALAALLARPTPPRPAWLPAGPATAPGWRRLVAQLDDPALAGLLARLAGGAGDTAGPGTALAGHWANALAGAAATLARPPAALRQAWWSEALAAALGGPAAADGEAHAMAEACRHLPWRLGLSEAGVARSLRAALDQAGSAGAGPAPVGLWRMLDRAWPAASSGGATATGAEPVPASQATPAGDAALAAAEAWLSRLAARMRAGAAGDVGTNAGDGVPGTGAARPAPPDPGGSPAWADGLAGLWRQAMPAQRQRLADLLAAGPPSESALAAWLADALASTGTAGATDHLAQLAAQGTAGRQASAQLLVRRLMAADTAPASGGADPAATGRATTAPLPMLDAITVGNAGLVLLWPFLTRFAERQGLLVEGRFQGPAQAERAALLLQHLATGDDQPPEFQLPLNKLLCGLAPDHVLIDQPPLSVTEQAECDDLLRAVIANAPVLRQMTLAGFRGSFLLRHGQLSGRDGHWLLRVERQAWDVVLDRFPWSASVVRLPWMPRLLQVLW